MLAERNRPLQTMAMNTTSPDTTNIGKPTQARSVSAAILTFKRPGDLRRCLQAIKNTLTDEAALDGFQWDEILVVDNDAARSGQSVAESEATDTPVAIRYVCETTPGVASARNRALDECSTSILLFIDDDEVPGAGWPNGLLSAMDESGAALVGGPVDTVFSTPPPGWVIDGDFFGRANPPHLSEQPWLRSGNLAIDLDQVGAAGLRFDQRLKVSEDVAFTRAAAASGLRLIWSRHGSVSEYVGADRFSVAWRCRREYLAQRGWSTVTMQLRDQPQPLLRTVLRAGHLLTTGLLGLVAAALPPSKADAVHALSRVSGGIGRFRGLGPR